ncbi:MAG TPA: hypothetical protein VE912_03475 [Bacteroidales bacterium]|nr:hypothetical protein [Bacteroidales bacterium]
MYFEKPIIGFSATFRSGLKGTEVQKIVPTLIFLPERKINRKELIMKTIMINDLTESIPSVLPYSLYLARQTDTHLHLLHIIDPRDLQSNYTPYSNSKSVTYSDVSGYDETVAKEKVIAEQIIKKQISREVSMINHPPVTDYAIEVDNIERRLKEISEEEDVSFLVFNGTPDHAIWEKFEEIHYIAMSAACPVWIIPAGTKYHPPEELMLLLGEGEETPENLHKVIGQTIPGEPEISTAYVKKDSLGKKLFNTKDSQEDEYYINNNEVYQKDDFLEILENHPESLPKAFVIRNSHTKSDRLFDSSFLDTIVNKFNIPVLII